MFLSRPGRMETLSFRDGRSVARIEYLLNEVLERLVVHTHSCGDARGVVHLVNTHLGLDEEGTSGSSSSYLQRQPSQAIPTIIAGGCDWRNTLAERSLATRGFQQVTSPPSEFRSFPSWLPVGGLDKIFFRGNVAMNEARVVRTSLARVASDHLPIVVDFSL